MNGPVVCGTDATWRSSRVLAVAGELSTRAGLQLTAFHATYAAEEQVLRMRGERIRSMIGDALGRNDVPIVLEHGDAAERLTAATASASILVIGSHGSPFGRRAPRMGVLTAVLRRSACPVVVVPRRAGPELKGASIVCAVRDRTDIATAATAACWADQLGLDLVLAAIARPPRAPLVAGVSTVPPPPVASVRDTVTATEHELAGLAGDIAPIARADCVTVPRPSPGRALRRIAQDADAALIVLGPTRKHAFLAGLTGSPRRSLLRSSECPLMICPATENALAARMLHADSSDVVAASAPRAPVSDGVRRARDRRDRRQR